MNDESVLIKYFKIVQSKKKNTVQWNSIYIWVKSDLASFGFDCVRSTDSICGRIETLHRPIKIKDQ